MPKYQDTRTKVPNYDSETRILVVDADEDFAKFFKIHLNKYFSKVFVTGNPKEALTWFEANPFDLVITDLNLPRIDGLCLIKKIRKMSKTIPIILMTTLDLSQIQKDKIESCNGFLNKPFSMKEFHVCLKEGLNKNGENSKPYQFEVEEN